MESRSWMWWFSMAGLDGQCCALWVVEVRRRMRGLCRGCGRTNCSDEWESCLSGVGRKVFAFLIINHCSATACDGSVRKCCSGSSQWSLGRQMAWQEGGDWN